MLVFSLLPNHTRNRWLSMWLRIQMFPFMSCAAQRMRQSSVVAAAAALSYVLVRLTSTTANCRCCTHASRQQSCCTRPWAAAIITADQRIVPAIVYSPESSHLQQVFGLACWDVLRAKGPYRVSPYRGKPSAASCALICMPKAQMSTAAGSVLGDRDCGDAIHSTTASCKIATLPNRL